MHLSRGRGTDAGGIIDAVARALYDGYADWYDENIAPFGLAATEAIRRLLAPAAATASILAVAPGSTSRRWSAWAGR